LVERIKTGKTEECSREVPTPLYQEKLNTLAQQLQTQVTLKSGKSGKGSLIIHYDNAHRLQKIMEQLMG
jgi:ParB family transcriptional regulator, chromosome partitioning protein